MSKTINIIARKTASKTVLNSEGNLSILLTEPSVVQIQGAPANVERYVRQGKDLLIYMKDGSVIRCSNYFSAFGEEDGKQSELVFMDDNQQLTHITFAETGESLGMGQVALTPQATPIASIEPFIEQSALDNLPWGWIAGGLLLGGGVGALLANDDGGGSHTTVIDNTRPVETAKPSFVVSDDQGDKQGVLSSNALTDDTTPTFSGTGQPGSTIQIKDASGNTVASAMVSSDGTWKVTLPTQDAGSHTWSVVQIDGSKTTDGGKITLEVVTAKASITADTVSGDNVVNATEAASAVIVSGQSKELAAGTTLTVTLNGKTYTTEVGANGSWQVSVPAADIGKLAQGTHQVKVTGTDSTGNIITGEQTLMVDTQAPNTTINKLTDDNVLNSGELATAQSLSGTTDAGEGQTVTVNIGGKSWTTTV
ncbi:BapA/Bap/LapF family prefix-like domain-containing protein [Pseudocitrobacter faecalis]|uniref:BapA/Bap/LapF family prefix-like domain-containing protein n=1 Tax=Pseudocitrobacter faecalis TaxID=1398493 RepID=UPI0039EF6070